MISDQEHSDLLKEGSEDLDMEEVKNDLHVGKVFKSHEDLLEFMDSWTKRTLCPLAKVHCYLFKLHDDYNFVY